jgi:hypothetical protein
LTDDPSTSTVEPRNGGYLGDFRLIKARAGKLLDPRHVLGRDLRQELDGDAAGGEVEVEHVLGLRGSGCGGAEGKPREEEGDGD